VDGGMHQAKTGTCGCCISMPCATMRASGIILDGGKAEGRQVVPSWWVAQATAKEIDNGAVATATSGGSVKCSYEAVGIFGQSITRFKDDRLIIVINSAWPAAIARNTARPKMRSSTHCTRCQINLTVICSWSAGRSGPRRFRILLRCGRPVRPCTGVRGMRPPCPRMAPRFRRARPDAAAGSARLDHSDRVSLAALWYAHDAITADMTLGLVNEASSRSGDSLHKFSECSTAMPGPFWRGSLWPPD